MAFDFKKEYKEFYLPKRKPEIIEVPPMNYVAVRGKGDPNEEGDGIQERDRRPLCHRLHHQDVEDGRYSH